MTKNDLLSKMRYPYDVLGSLMGAGCEIACIDNTRIFVDHELQEGNAHPQAEMFVCYWLQ